MKKKHLIDIEGIDTESLPNAMFRVSLNNGCKVLTHISRKIRHNYIRILLGDRVEVKVSPYDLTKAHIIHQLHTKSPNG
jgi:translation initiation factor IF-1